MTHTAQPPARGVLAKWRELLSSNRASREAQVKTEDQTDPVSVAGPTLPPETEAEPRTQDEPRGPDLIGTTEPQAQDLTLSERLNMNTDLGALTQIGGFIGCCLVDSETGLMLSSEGGGRLDLEAASALNTQVVQAKLQAISALKLDDAIEDLLITLGKQYHLIRPLATNPSIFIYLALDRKAANLGLARLKLKDVEATLSL